MAEFSGRIDLTANLGAVLIRADGTIQEYDLGNKSFSIGNENWLKRMWRKLRTSGLIPIALTFAALFSSSIPAIRPCSPW